VTPIALLAGSRKYFGEASSRASFACATPTLTVMSTLRTQCRNADRRVSALTRASPVLQ
jgi:hypothetical protein